MTPLEKSDDDDDDDDGGSVDCATEMGGINEVALLSLVSTLTGAVVVAIGWALASALCLGEDCRLPADFALAAAVATTAGKVLAAETAAASGPADAPSLAANVAGEAEDVDGALLVAFTVAFALPLVADATLDCGAAADDLGGAVLLLLADVGAAFGCETAALLGATAAGCAVELLGRDLSTSAAVDATAAVVAVAERCAAGADALEAVVVPALRADIVADACLLPPAAPLFRPLAVDLEDEPLLRWLFDEAPAPEAGAVFVDLPPAAGVANAGAAATAAAALAAADVVEIDASDGVAASVAAAAVALPVLLVDALLPSQAAGVGFALQLTRGNICRMSTSGSLISAVMR